jgi:hypothetical protein
MNDRIRRLAGHQPDAQPTRPLELARRAARFTLATVVFSSAVSVAAWHPVGSLSLGLLCYGAGRVAEQDRQRQAPPPPAGRA